MAAREVFSGSQMKCLLLTLIDLVLLSLDSKNNPKHLTNSKGRRRRPGTKEFASAVKTNDENFLGFLSRCLDWDPTLRITPEEALQHDWILEVGGH